MGLQNLQSLSGVVLTVLICWLLSDKASYTSAANLRVGGGRP